MASHRPRRRVSRRREPVDTVIAGVVAFVPLVFILAIALVFVPLTAGPGAGVQLALWVSVLLVLLLAAVYTVGLAILGAYVKEEV